MKMLFIGNTWFRRKIVYHNKMHLHYPSLKKRLAPSSIKSRTHVFKKVSATALDYAYVFLILTRVFSLQKSRLVFYDIIYVIMYEIIYFTLAFFYPHYELNEQAVIVCRLEYENTYRLFYKQHFFPSTQLQCFLTFHQFIFKCCLGVNIYTYMCIYREDSISVISIY